MELPSAIVSLGLSDLRMEEPCFVGKNPLDMPRTPYWLSEGKQPTMIYHPTRHLYFVSEC